MVNVIHIGNVIKDEYGNLIIIVRKRSDGYDWVSFSFSNMSGFISNGSITQTHTCMDGINTCDDIECEHCQGKGYYDIVTSGIDKSTKLADSVKEYITNTLLKGFDF